MLEVVKDRMWELLEGLRTKGVKRYQLGRLREPK